MSDFSNVFKNLRKQHNMTQTEIAEALGTTRSAVGMWEQGKRIPAFEMLEHIAGFFNVDMNYLTGKSDYFSKTIQEDDIVAIDSSEKRLLRRYRNVTKDPKDREKLEKFLDTAFEFFENDEDA